MKSFPILRAKLKRPPVGGDFVCREAVEKRLESTGNVPLVLVSAPAGYGKTSLVSHWLEKDVRESAWLSLDETDNELALLATYLVAAVRTTFPEACRRTLDLASSGKIPRPDVFATHLSNDLDAIGAPLVLVLDDYHTIQNRAIHDLLDCLLRHPLDSVQLVLITRRDPPLSLGALRAKGRLFEIRLQDLQFTKEQADAFLKKAAPGTRVGDTALSRLQDMTEGWAAALRLIAVALQHGSELESLLKGYGADSGLVRDYLLEEVLLKQDPAVRDCLVTTSVFDRFCASLFESVCGGRFVKSEETFRDLLNGTGLLFVTTDLEETWYRYHHLLRDLLRRQLQKDMARDEIASLHRRASAWFETHGLIEEALEHALRGGDPEGAARLVADNGNAAMNREQWGRLSRWLGKIPASIVERDPRLLLLNAWLLEFQSRLTESWRLAKRASSLLAEIPAGSSLRARLEGEIAALRSQEAYVAAEPEEAVLKGEEALQKLPPESHSTRGFGICLLAASLQMAGKLARAESLLYEALADDTIPLGTFQSRVIVTLCWIHWIAGELSRTEQAASRLSKLGEELGLRESQDFSRYFLGLVHYERNELSAAEKQLTALVVDPDVTRTELYAHGAFLSSSVYLASGRPAEARGLTESVAAHLLEAHHTAELPLAEAFIAELDLRQGRLAEASSWAGRFDPGPLRPRYMFHAPELTLVKTLLAEGTPESRKRAEASLARISDYSERTHNQRQQIEVLALRALFHEGHDDNLALSALERAVQLALPGGFIRVFVDAGPELADLLKRLDLNPEGLRFAGRILRAFMTDEASPKSASAPNGLVEPLSKRELEILALLAERLSNREIGEKLHISPVTVKRHTANIYGKLGVHDRRAAVDKALHLGIAATP